jgi:polar amino acid transport system substrate-binding protein
MPAFPGYKYLLLVIMTSSIVLGWSQNGSASSTEKVILTTHNLYPYGSYPAGAYEKVIADDTFKGVAVDRVRCVFEEMGLPLEIQVVPWRRAQLLAERGDADGFFAASQNDARDEFAEKTTIIAEQKWNWYLLKDNPLSPGDPSFKEKASVGGFVGANMLKWMKEQKYNVTTTPKDTEGLLKLLLARRVDAVMANNYVMQALLQKYGVQDQVKIYLNLDKPLFVYFSKEFLKTRPMFMENFNNLVPECSQSSGDEQQ